ncbi:peptide-methionine (S)-S-oxide reductase MsrA [Roseivirga sp. BDSF3-8]|uniref:peptide-methionine (S)-S-oxide reductase MsrA n=1 Tax=Roseivirga sp. BDSF3-8 TaxID=3241598 RepID=UPI003531D81B
MEKATFGSGCFWCTEAIFQRLKGVEKVVSGYSGGHIKNPAYREVCNGVTGHAEVVQLTYDPEVITYDELLEVFWKTHDPTTLNRQGYDVGTQYRSAVFYHTEEQRKKAVYYKQKLEEEDIFGAPIVTEISPLETFYAAEGAHQDYYNNYTSQPYCQAVILPKVKKLKQIFSEKLKQEQNNL